MTEETKKILVQYLTQETFSFNGIERYSTLNAGLRECRLMTKRNGSGQYDKEKPCGYPGHWLGAIGYFTILDQVGTFFRQKGEVNQGATNKIEMAIRRFGFDLIDKDELKLDALLALRNCFTHDFNLLNIPTNPKKIPQQQHKFEVYYSLDQNENIVSLPTTNWDGNIPDKDFYRQDDTTRVNLFGLGSFVETVVQRVIEQIETDSVELDNDLQFLINKYTFVTSNHYVKNAH